MFITVKCPVQCPQQRSERDSEKQFAKQRDSSAAESGRCRVKRRVNIEQHSAFGWFSGSLFVCGTFFLFNVQYRHVPALTMAISGQSQSIVCHRQGNLLCSRLFWEYGTSGLNRKLYWRVIESVPRGELCGCWSETSLGTTGKHKHTLYRNTSWNFLSTIDEKMCFVYTTIARSWYIFGGIHSHRCQLVSLITLRNWHRNSRLRPHLIDSKGGLKVTLCHGRKKIKISRQSVWLFFFGGLPKMKS